RYGQFSLISAHKDQEGHEFDWSGVCILAHARTKNEREFMEAWSSTEEAINKHIPATKSERTPKMQADCQARRTEQQPPDQQPINSPELAIFQQNFSAYSSLATPESRTVGIYKTAGHFQAASSQWQETMGAMFGGWSVCRAWQLARRRFVTDKENLIRERLGEMVPG
ncbi:hypothetical protein T265_15305, partial [Opisthorchis viverrini]